MKRSVIAAGLAILAMGATSTAVLATQGGPRSAPSFEAIDADGDGQLTRDEMTALGARFLSRADTDGDGALSTAELEAEAVERARRMMSQLDTDADGVLSAQELRVTQRAMRAFDRADRNDDGVVSRAEFDESRARMAHRGSKPD